MSRRLEIELTSKREDGSYSWRAAGAKQPKGSLGGDLLYDGAAIGDVVRADADFAVDGVTIISVLPPKAKRKEAETLEILGSGRDEGGVTTQLVKGKRGGRDGDRDSRGKGRGRNNRGDRGRSGRDGDRGRSGGDRDGRGSNNRGARGRDDRSSRDGARGNRSQNNRSHNKRPQDNRPKPKRLRPKRIHRDAALREIAEIQRPLARIVLRDGVPGVRQLVEKQNDTARKAGQPEIPPKMLEAVGEKLLPRLRSAEWRDNAEAALAGIHELDLRDLRKVVVAAENGAKDDESRALAEQLKEGLTQRVDAEHGKWLAELNSLLNEGRTVRALRQSSRPPKAGAPIPADIATRLTDGANSSMTSDTAPERWATVLDAVAFSPVRQQVLPQGLPAKSSDELVATVKKLAKRVPHIAAMFAPAPAAAAAPAPIPAPPTPAPAESSPAGNEATAEAPEVAPEAAQAPAGSGEEE